MERGKIISVNVSEKKGVKKKAQDKIFCRENHGFEGDAHSGNWHRQVSLLLMESILKMNEKGIKTGPGDFAENLTVSGLVFSELKKGMILRAGEARLEITQFGKECHSKCEIFRSVGACVMPTEGIFARVLSSGWIKKGDTIEVEKYDQSRDPDNK